ncbi:MAG: F0F1 ATP synthase subunit A [Flexistipes sinusarabici]|uniref:ATP synthase subunit a n=1 Tax=Flexistipes sinusarabici TaxID=2352 RepID=A0A5D0MMZ7_FLESI|nr:F0F1 ATP synthase subunit A [Flexistipes sinusarabici]TYB34376.1 MAG: F0F1 ATP synthase subunit A [Flexistipes sinusarabici]
MEHPLNIFSFLPHEITAKYLHVLMTFVVILISLVIGLIVSKKNKMVPDRSQNAIELAVNGVYDMCMDIMGKDGKPYFPLVFAIGLYVLFSNVLGLVPGFSSPTANLNTTLAPALIVFVTYNFIGIKKHGAGYIKHFMGPILWLSPLMIIIEIIGHISRPVSLSVRLFGNIFGKEVLLMVLFMLVPFLVPLPIYFLGIFVAVLQTYVFMMLTMIYISGALEEAH